MELTVDGLMIRNHMRELIMDLVPGEVKASDFLPSEYDFALTGYTYSPFYGFLVEYDYNMVMDMAENNSKLNSICEGKKVAFSTDLEKALPEKDKEAMEKMAAQMDKEAQSILLDKEPGESGKDFINE